MARLRKLTATAFILMLMAGISGWLDRAAYAGAPEPMAVKVLLTDYAGVSRDVLERARMVTTMIYRRIGVDIMWFGAGVQTQEIPDDPAANAAFAASVLVVNLHAEMPLVEWDRLSTLGRAITRSRVARVYMEPVEHAACKARVESSLVLGHVIAHELGHLLLPAPSHSPQGLMRAALDDTGMRMRRLWFDETQGALIRSRLSGSSQPVLIARGREPGRP